MPDVILITGHLDVRSWLHQLTVGEAIESVVERGVVNDTADNMWRAMLEMVQHDVRERVREWVHA